MTFPSLSTPDKKDEASRRMREAFLLLSSIFGGKLKPL
jgi:hypothetical protein